MAHGSGGDCKSYAEVIWGSELNLLIHEQPVCSILVGSCFLDSFREEQVAFESLLQPKMAGPNLPTTPEGHHLQAPSQNLLTRAKTADKHVPTVYLEPVGGKGFRISYILKWHHGRRCLLSQAALSKMNWPTWALGHR